VPLWNLIRDQKTFQLPSLMQRGKGAGIVRLNDSLADLVKRGSVEKTEALRASPAPDELEALLKGETAPQAPPTQKQPPQERAGLLERAGAFFNRKDDR
jgi:twitching motility protein PilT